MQQKLTWNGCNDSEKLVIAFVYSAAIQVAEQAKNWTRQAPTNHDWIRQWFGERPAISHVRSTLDNVHNTLRNGALDLICDHNQHASCIGFWARAQGTREVRICQDYWSLPPLEQMYTLLHEVAHHSGAPTDDGNGEERLALYLAQVHPREAARSAWNYDFYYHGWTP